MAQASSVVYVYIVKIQKQQFSEAASKVYTSVKNLM